MGRGDQRSRRGKVFAGSYGNRRPRKGNKKKSNAGKA
jgi:30S ribosomal protein S31